jgi:hypothetical protein
VAFPQITVWKESRPNKCRGQDRLLHVHPVAARDAPGNVRSENGRQLKLTKQSAMLDCWVSHSGDLSECDKPGSVSSERGTTGIDQG